VKRYRSDFIKSEPVERIKRVSTITPVAASTSNLTGAALVLLNTIAEGSTGTTRIGRSIRLTRLRLNVEGQTTSAAQPGSLRLVIVWDKFPKGAAPGNPFISGTLCSLPDPVSEGVRYDVLFDQTNVMGLYGTAVLSSTNPLVCNFKVDIKLNHVVQYSGATAAIASIATGALYAGLQYRNVLDVPSGSSMILEFEDI